MLLTKRKFLTGLIAAPLVVSYQNIMPVKLFVSEVPKFDPIYISLIRQYGTNLMAYDICGVQPMTGEIAKIFALKSKYQGA